MEPFFIRTFWITVIMLWVALIILYFILTNREALKRKGHQEQYISYLRRSHSIRLAIIALLLPLLILLSAWIVTLITGPLSEEVQMGYIVLILIALVMPFKFIDERINQKRIKQLALETKEKVAIDLNYKVLHQVFNPFWEIVLGPAAFLYGFFFLKIEEWVIYLFLLIPWFMYLNIRGTKYQTRPYLKDNYRYMFAFNIFNFLFFLLYFGAYYLIKIRVIFGLNGEELSSGSPLSKLPANLLLFTGLIIILGLTIRVAIYLANYRAFNRAINGDSSTPPTAASRKLGFVISGIVLLFGCLGIGTLTGMVKNCNTEVGLIQQKYIIQEQKNDCDTLLVINKYSSINADEYDRYFRNKNVKLSCKVKLSRTEQVKCYEICCPSTFEALRVGQIVKFEYGSGSSIIRILE